MYNKLSRWFTMAMTMVCSVLGMSITVFASNPLMGDETQDTVKLMTVLLIASAALIILLVGTSAIKKKRNK